MLAAHAAGAAAAAATGAAAGAAHDEVGRGAAMPSLVRVRPGAQQQGRPPPELLPPWSASR